MKPTFKQKTEYTNKNNYSITDFSEIQRHDLMC